MMMKTKKVLYQNLDRSVEPIEISLAQAEYLNECKK